MKHRVIDLFAGVGGLSYGFAHDNDFEIVIANEYDPIIAKAYSLNHPSVDMIVGDIRNIQEKSLLDKIGNRKIDLIVGGPPCQSYSTLGKRLMDDRANLFFEYRRILKIVNPKAFIYENVSGLLSMDGGNLFPIIKQEFSKLGYIVKFKLLNAVEYGVPQYRERVILVGATMQNDFEYPEPTHGSGLFVLPEVAISDALGDLPKLKSGESSIEYSNEPLNDFQCFVRDSNLLTEHEAPTNNPHLIKIMEALPDGGTKRDLPIDLRPRSGYGNTYAKMWWNKPSPTITRNFATPSSSRCIHPRDSRALSTREGARLQSFPDSYLFYGSRSMKHLEIGNAVPPLLSIALTKQIKKIL